MAYKVYLIEDIDVNNWIELDCEGVDFSTTFAVSQVADIANRTDSITKQIRFNGTKTNNLAFGSFFHQNVVADFELDNRLFFNYNPLRAVDCLIYEDSALLLRGELRVVSIDSDASGNPIYETVITGSFINFKETIQTLLLDDLDFTDFRHRYSWNNIKDSWDLRTERYNVSGNTYSFKPFQKGSGYVYPFIDYGHIYKNIDANANLNSIPIKNFKPAIFVKEYFDRIFSQEALVGYTYEVKGSSDLIDRFNSLIIPCNVEKLNSKSSTSLTVFSDANQTRDSDRTVIDGDNFKMYRYVNLDSFIDPNDLVNSYGNYLDGELPQCVYVVNREFLANGYAKLTFANIFNKYLTPVKVTLQLCERDFIAAADGDFDSSNWNVIQSSNTVTIPKDAGLNNVTLEMEIGERTYEETSQLCLRVFFEGAPFALEFSIFGVGMVYTINHAQFKFPKDSNSSITYGLDINDVMIPEPVKGIKQMDFIKSIINLFNLYVYTEKERPKHLIFQTYNDYYAYSSLNLLPTNAVDWSAKIDYSKPPKVKPNIDLPKSYLFTFKDDDDYINKDYKTRNSEACGTFKFNDSYGLRAEKKVELLFSPSPLVQYKGTGRIHPAIYTVESNNKKPTKSNVRIMYYNGVKFCQPYFVGKDVVTDATYTVLPVGLGLSTYPQAGNYYLGLGVNNSTPIDDLNFGVAKTFYFDNLSTHLNCPTGYQVYYRDQVSELTKPNISFVSCQGYLNEIDVANLNLRRPVFVDFGKWGHHYYKVLSVEYHNRNEMSELQLQKITI